MYVIITCKYEKDPNQKQLKKGNTDFSIIPVGIKKDQIQTAKKGGNTVYPL